VAASFAALGAHLLAAEASAAAAAAYQRADPGRPRRGIRGPGGSAGRGVRGRPDPRPGAADEPAGLTRELEIARMAASGLSSRAIAARLVVAVRTVDNALGQVYAKPCIAPPGTEI
jgi:DNA-binding NarL/FixJ family response regulator